MGRSYQSLRQDHLLCVTIMMVVVGAGIAVAPRSAHAATLVVDDDGLGTAGNCNAAAPAFPSIQAAVTAAAQGDTIFVCPGTYDEQVIVATSNLTIQGAGTGASVLRPTVVVANTVRPGTNSPVAPIVLVDGVAGVRVANLTIDGSVADSGAAVFPSCAGLLFYTGIYYRNGSGSVDGAHVTNIMSETACTFGVLVQTDQSGVGASANVVITNSLVDHYGVGGINCLGQNTACTLTRNTVRGEGPVDNLLQIGIVVRTEASSVISGNVITDHFFLGAHGVPEFAAGIFLFFADPSSNPHLLQNNIFANNQANVQRVGTAAAVD